MISFISFSDELQKIAAEGAGYRAPTTWDRLGPEGYLGEAIPNDPEERKQRYLSRTKFLPVTSGLLGGAGMALAGGSHAGGKGALIGGALGAAAGAGGSLLGRYLAGRHIKTKAMEEALVRNTKAK